MERLQVCKVPIRMFDSLDHKEPMKIGSQLIEKLLLVKDSPQQILSLFNENDLGISKLISLNLPLDSGFPYTRQVLFSNHQCEIMVAYWSKGQSSAPHDHGSSKGWVFFLQGNFEEKSYKFLDSGLVDSGKIFKHMTGDVTKVQNGDIHSCTSMDQNGISFHVYFPKIHKMKVFDLSKRQTLTVTDDCGAWIPKDPKYVVSKSNWPEAKSKSHVLILYTTLYREGGEKFEKAAKVLAEQKKLEFPSANIICQAVERKSQFVDEFEKIQKLSEKIVEFHFIGHSGLYGIMFGTTAWPEQLSPYEWKNLTIPFAPEAKAYFHACRSGRWFAPFFARTFQVKSYGHFWYTTVSLDKDRFAWEGLRSDNKPIYIISVPGKKSHGLLGSVKKYLLRPQQYPMSEFLPQSQDIDTTYNSVAPLYDETFDDISVRADELKWLRGHLKGIPSQKLLDIGCGTGSFMRAISDLVEGAHGVDLSSGMIAQAQRRSPADKTNLTFSKIDGPKLPFADNSFDIVTSVLSFRYLDWDPIVSEILRILKPGGHLLVIDMVAAPIKWRHWPYLLVDKLKQQLTQIRYPQYRKALNKMVTDDRWKKMLEYNPMRAEHELKWYLESRFPGGKTRVINYAFHSRVVAFKSPPVFHKKVEKLSYP
jgi:ubiquinone/menaquinone biosynthesis C-methylase UbiE